MKVLKKCVKDVLKLDLSDTYSIFVIHPRMECIEYNNQFNADYLYGLLSAIHTAQTSNGRYLWTGPYNKKKV